MAKNLMGRKHLVIGDAHATPGINNRRFEWLGQVIVEEQPDVIIGIGDWADMASLCSYEKGKKSFEGRRYKHDINVAIDAQERMFDPLIKLQKRQSKGRRKQYIPELHMCLGNHEDRINTAIQYDATIEGLISIDDLQYDYFGWHVWPYFDQVEIDGVTYSHCFASGGMNRPISGEHPATMLLNKQHMSCTAGHSHFADWSVRRRGVDHLMGCFVGCYFEHQMDYVSRNVNDMYWRGLVIKRNVVEGCYDPQFLSLNTIKKVYL